MMTVGKRIEKESNLTSMRVTKKAKGKGRGEKK